MVKTKRRCPICGKSKCQCGKYRTGGFVIVPTTGVRAYSGGKSRKKSRKNSRKTSRGGKRNLSELGDQKT